MKEKSLYLFDNSCSMLYTVGMNWQFPYSVNQPVVDQLERELRQCRQQVFDKPELSARMHEILAILQPVHAQRHAAQEKKMTDRMMRTLE